MTFTDASYGALQGALLRIQSQAQNIPFPPYAPDKFHDGISRLDVSHFYMSPSYPDLMLVQNWRPSNTPYGENDFTEENGKNMFVPKGPGFTNPRFFLTTDRKHYTLFNERQYQVSSWNHYFDRLSSLPGHLIPHDAQLAQGDHRQIYGLFDLVRVINGTYCLTPEEVDDARKIFLSFFEHGKEAVVQMGNDPRYGIKLYLSASFPQHANPHQVPSVHKGSIKEFAPSDFMSPFVHNRFFHGAHIFIAGQNAQPAQYTENGKTLDQIMEDLNRLIGLNAIKEQIRDFADLQNFSADRKSNGFDEKEKPNLHAAFIGPPGTGKTTVAKMLGGMYRELGLLSKGHVHKVSANELIAGYVGQTTGRVKAAIDAARGGVLFIDEAYGLKPHPDRNTDFGATAIQELLQEMSDGPGDIAIVFAGYDKEMADFINSNTGMDSRLSFYQFPNYTHDELLQIAGVISQSRELKFSDEALRIISQIVQAQIKKNSANFGNARFIERLVDRAKQKLAKRSMQAKRAGIQLTREELALITAEDIVQAAKDMPHLNEKRKTTSQIGFVKEEIK